jgi:hypothetical protein
MDGRLVWAELRIAGRELKAEYTWRVLKTSPEAPSAGAKSLIWLPLS